jgi:CDP-4-dehydro-6-deoxyglucose reductase
MSHQVTVLPSGHQFTVNAGQTVLDAALKAGIGLPYGCKNGACGSCKGKVMSGDVSLAPHQARALSADEVKQGMTLFCCASPLTDVTIEAREVRAQGDIQIRKLPCRVQGMERAASDVMLLSLQLPANERFQFLAGQYVEILLKDGKRRSYSMASAPHEEGPMQLHIRHLPGGLFTDHVFGVGATQMKEREILRFEGPFGSFFLREDSDKPIIMVASGTGFAPLRAIVEHMAFKDIRRPVRLYWGGRRPQDLYLDAVARAWAESRPDFQYIPVVSHAQAEDGWTGRTGFVHQAVMQDLPALADWEVYACGAPAMVDAARRDFSAQCGLPVDAFYADSFTSEADVADPVVI